MKLRILLLTFSLFSLFAILIGQFFYLQISQGEFWSRRADRQHFFRLKEPFRRGTFYSNTSVKQGHPEEVQPFVMDVQVFHLYADPDSIPDEDRKVVAAWLATFLGKEEGVIFHELNRKSRSRSLAKWLPADQKAKILDWWRPFAREHRIARNALFFQTDYERSYPFGKMLGQVLHTIQKQKDENTGQANPTGGLELALNSYLSGQQGIRRLMRSPRNRIETGEVEKNPVHGADVYLTINHVLQGIAEEELRSGVKRSRAKGGWAVMMDPGSGEILALAQYPYFHPSKYQYYFNDPEKTEFTKIKALTDAQEPGSVMKAIVLSLALEAGVFDPEEKVSTSDGKFPGRSKPITDTGIRPHQHLDMDMAVWKSSNIYPARMMERLVEAKGNQWIRDQLVHTFGFGQKTELEVYGESPGLVPRPGKLHPNGKLEWSTPTPFSLAMGYNLQANAVQICRAMAVFANGGKLVYPTLIKDIVRGNEHLYEQKKLPKQVLDQKIVNRIVESMRYVSMPGGTGRRANVPGFTEVGKSGTARKIIGGAYTRKQHIASFVGFAPATHPRFVLFVALDEPEVLYIPGVGHNNHGGVSAAPVFRHIARRTLEYLGESPDDPYGYPKGDVRADAEKTAWMTETRQLQEKYNSWNSVSQ